MGLRGAEAAAWLGLGYAPWLLGPLIPPLAVASTVSAAYLYPAPKKMGRLSAVVGASALRLGAAMAGVLVSLLPMGMAAGWSDSGEQLRGAVSFLVGLPSIGLGLLGAWYVLARLGPAPALAVRGCSATAATRGAWRRTGSRGRFDDLGLQLGVLISEGLLALAATALVGSWSPAQVLTVDWAQLLSAELLAVATWRFLGILTVAAAGYLWGRTVDRTDCRCNGA